MEYHKEEEEEAPARSSNGIAEKEVVRATANFSPSVWGDYFISRTSSTAQNDDSWIEHKIEELKMEVKAMFGTNDNLAKTLSLIDDLQRLGLSYHFEDEISETLRRVHNENSDTNDLHLVALCFRLLRQQGYNVSSDVFYKFKDRKVFKHGLSGDAKVLLHMYEATWLGMHEDEILDKAQDFARASMQKLAANQEDKHFTKLIIRALDMPLRRRLTRLEAREYISIYEELEGSNALLLALAKLDFNRLQSLHQAEIKNISMWWRELGFAKKLSFIKDRVPESYFWSMGICFEPRYSRGRILLSKLIVMWTVLDDMYDAYGTFDELQLLTDAIDRWDLQVQDVHHLPEYMRIFFISFGDFIREIEEELMRKERIHHMSYIIKMFKSITGAYLEEAKWANEGYTPSLEEYLQNGLTSGGLPMTCFALCLMGDATEETLEWVVSTPKIVEASTIIGRLLNDITTNKFEQKRMHVASALQCYMKDSGATEHEATMKLKEMVANALKDINKEWLDPLPSRKHVNVLALACAQVTEFLYGSEDIFTHPAGRMKETIASLLVHPIQD